MDAIEDRTRSPWLHLLPLALLLAAWALSYFGEILGLHGLLCAAAAGLTAASGCLLWGSLLILLFRSRRICGFYVAFTILSTLLSLITILPAHSAFPWELDAFWCFPAFAVVFGIAPLLMLFRVLPNRNLYSKLLSISRYPVELTDKHGNLFAETLVGKPLAPAQRDLLISGGQNASLSLSPDWVVNCLPIPNGFALVRHDLHDKNLLQTSLDEVEAEIAGYRELLSKESALREELRVTQEETRALGTPISVLREKESEALELIRRAEAEDCSPMQRRRLLQNALFVLISAERYGFLLKSTKAGEISAASYGSAVNAVLQSLGGLGLSATLRNIAGKSYSAAAILRVFLSECELLQTAVDSHWSDMSTAVRDDGNLLRTVFSMTGADSSQVAAWARDRRVDLLTSGIRVGSGLEAGRCSIYFHISGGVNDDAS